MINSYTRGVLARCLRQFGLAALLVGGTAAGAQAQVLNYLTSAASNTTTVYTDLGTTGTAIATANADDANSAAQAIGFTFGYNGANFTQFVLNTNGFLKLGATAPSAAAMFLDETAGSSITDPFQSPADPNIMAPFNFDLTAGAAGNTEYRVATTGATGSRICTIQWKNVQDKASANPTQYTNMSFQVRLYEGTNLIEFVYDAATVGTTSALRFTQIGLKGTSFADGRILQLIKQSGAAWSAATFADFSNVAASNNLNTFNIRSIAPPDAGRTFRFTPIPPIPNDIAVTVIYTYGKLASPLALPHAVRAVVTNAGLAAQTNVAVTLNVTGANTFTDTKTVASLAVGASATVTFNSYPATLTAGTNTVTVTVPADGNNANNSATYGQIVTDNRISYTDPTKPANGAVGLGNAIFASKYNLSASTVISDVVLTFGASPAATPNTAPFQVVLYDATATGGLPGQVLYTSAAQNRTAAGGDVTVAIPSVAVPASFYIGVKETSATNILIAFQTEAPIRPGTFYYSTNGTVWNDFINVTPKARIAIEFGTITPSCAPPTAITATNVTATGATIAFTGQASGTSGYEILYGPTGFNIATAGTLVSATTSPVTLTGLSPATTYQVYVRSTCTAGGTSIYTTPISFTTACDPNPAIATFPYNQNFDAVIPGRALPCGLTVLDANNDGTTWTVSKTNPSSGTSAIRYNGLTLNNVAADDWFFTPPLVLAANTRYQVAFRYRGEGIVNSPSSFTESLEVKSGATPTVAGQTNLLYSNAAITNTSYAQANATSTPAVALLPAGAGTQYVGFHIKSAANQGSLYIDDVTVTATAVTATSEALLRAVTVFPNPSTTGVFDLEIHGANAKGRLDVVVTNALGQRVYAGAARDNYTNKLDLSGLASGIYLLQVRNGDESLTRRVSIVK